MKSCQKVINSYLPFITYRSLIHVEISEKEFFRKIEEVFDKGEGNIEVDNLGDIKIQVKKFDDKTKSLELKLIKEFKLK